MRQVLSSTLEPLDYILTVDVFSEGVDIVEVNQVIMLRPTQSPIVFIQQLGRGLRKAQGKEYVVVLDFIGNYKNNFHDPDRFIWRSDIQQRQYSQVSDGRDQDHSWRIYFTF